VIWFLREKLPKRKQRREHRKKQPQRKLPKDLPSMQLL